MVNRLTCAARNILGGLLIASLPWGAAQALIDISPKIAVMKDDQLTVSVTNRGDTPEFVEIGLLQLGNPGVPPDEELLTPLGIVRDPTLYAAPFKLSLGPRQTKQVQLKALKKPEKEQVFRLSVVPQQQAKISGTQNNVMLVSLGYMGLVRQLPAKQVTSWRHQCTATGMRIEATGTMRVEFSELQAMDDFNVYPGTPRQFSDKQLSGKAQGKPFTLQCSA